MNSTRIYLPCLMALAAVAWGATPAWGQPPAVSDDAAARQRSATAAMQDSLAQQQASIHKQVDRSAGGGFFVLPRASSLGTNAAPTVQAQAFPAPADPGCDPLPAMQVEALVGETAERDGLSADLLRSVMQQESGFRPCAVSSKGAAGLMQLMPSTAEQFGIANPFDPASNLDAGARFLKQLLNRYGGDLPKALGAYNAGPAKVDAAGTVPAIPETEDYVKQILSSLRIR